MNETRLNQRTMGLLGATSIGVGAIVGGGILALAGVAFASTGASAILAFALNGVIALLSALSFAEMSAAFPQSGGTYVFAKKVLNVRTAFIVGWIVWFASLVAAVLYALGFAVYAVIVLEQLWLSLFDSVPVWLSGRWMVLALAILATLVYSWQLLRPSSGGGDWATYGKVVVFGILIAAGLWALLGEPAMVVRQQMNPFFSAGALGFFQAMGFSFIALQGFDLIAAVAGEVKQPERTIPRAMLISLATALLIYLPLLFIVVTVGIPFGESLAAVAQAQPETIVALAAQNFLGGLGYWLVVVAALLSMLSALQANLFAASRIVQTMAEDRTMPAFLARRHKRYGTPVMAIILSSLVIIAVLVLIPDVAAAGAAASLIFLLSFALVHWMSSLLRQRSDEQSLPYRTPLYPLVPLTGGLACLVLAVFQGLVVPVAGAIALLWIALGVGLYVPLLARQAQAADAVAEALDPHLVMLRGRSPLVLVPIANPGQAASLVAVADALTPASVGRVMLLNVVIPQSNWESDDIPELQSAQAVLKNALIASHAADFNPAAMITVAKDPWREIARVAAAHRCESLLMGFSQLNETALDRHLEGLMHQIESDVVILRRPDNWSLASVKRILVPVAGKGDHDVLRSRLLASLDRRQTRNLTYLRVLPSHITDASFERSQRALLSYAQEEVWGDVTAVVVRSDDAKAEIIARSQNADLIILGSERSGRHQASIGSFARSILAETSLAVMLINRRS